jgi:hypothetical protein
VRLCQREYRLADPGVGAKIVASHTSATVLLAMRNNIVFSLDKLIPCFDHRKITPLHRINALLVIVRLPLPRLMVAGYVRLKLITSPLFAATIAARSVLAPLSRVLVTVKVAPKTGVKTARMSSRKIGGEILVRILAEQYTATRFECERVFRQRLPSRTSTDEEWSDPHHCIRRPCGSSVFLSPRASGNRCHQLSHPMLERGLICIMGFAVR